MLLELYYLLRDLNSMVFQKEEDTMLGKLDEVAGFCTDPTMTEE